MATPVRAGMKRRRAGAYDVNDLGKRGERVNGDAADAPMEDVDGVPLCAPFHQEEASTMEDADDDSPCRKRAMLIHANLRFLEKIPPLRDYQRSSNGRRGAIDGGTLSGAMLMSALEESFEETSFVTLEPPLRTAMVMPAPLPLRIVGPTAHARPIEIHPRANRPSRIRPAEVRPMSGGGKDDEARPASQ